MAGLVPRRLHRHRRAKIGLDLQQNCLSDHQGIYLPNWGPLYFEDPYYEEAPADYFARLFEGRCERMVGIRRPNYIGKPGVSGRIMRDPPDILKLQGMLGHNLSHWLN